ncbi:MAG TPA: UDP-glucose 4-epimerase GalE [Candidatus Mcinerneyibacterium sp.]|nr:UDP-glucose 4-epimerase GalE [Candidatus Mcinerneyibacterium sp.]
MNKKTILVVGGAGYIGSHQVKCLLENDYRVVIYDNLSTGFKKLILSDNFIKGDLKDTKNLEETIDKFKPDAVMHFAAFTSVGESVKKPSKYYRNNLVNVINLLDVMVKNGVNNFIFSSSAAVYGVPENIPITEEETKNPINPYGRTKLMVERVLKDYEKAYGLKYTALRYFNAAGADKDGQIGEMHDPETHLIPIVLKTALGKRDIIYIFGNNYDTRDGTCVRDYIHVNDLADAHLKALERLFAGGESISLNLGSGEGYSVKEIIDYSKKITGIDFKVDVTERREGDPPILVADSSRAEKILGWKRKYDLEDIIRTAWRWHKNQ